MARKMTTNQLGKELKNYTKEQMAELIMQLYNSCPQANDYLNVRLGTTAYEDALLREAKDNLDKIFFPRRRTKRFSMQDAKAIVTDFQMISQEPSKMIDLEMYFSEQAVAFAGRYEGMGNSFYTITEDVFRSAISRLNQDEDGTIYNDIKDRIDALRKRLPGTGLENAFENIYQELKWLPRAEKPSEQKQTSGKAYEVEIGETLPPEDGKLFFALFYPLLNYVNNKKHILDVEKIEFGGNTNSEIKKVADVVWSEPELIDEYLTEEGSSLPEDHQQILAGWKRAKTDRFVMERHLKRGSIIISAGSDSVYQVRGITSSLEEMTYGMGLPLVIDMTLLPFRNVIISDGLVSILNIFIGRGMARNLKETYMKAKREHKIISSL